jgi:NhaA family Na+:H+ antiporter
MRDSTPEQPVNLPQEPIHRITAPLRRFLHVQAASGAVLLAATVVALVLANSPWSEGFLGIWQSRGVLSMGAFEFNHSLKHLINDGLMVIFFFVIGLEVKRELVLGELREFRRAVLPVAAALGGMVVPAICFLAIEYGGPGQRGWGIPMATDIAFVVGCTAVLGNRVPHSLRILLLSLAIADDIGAILVIAIGYTDDINLLWLAWGLVGIGLVGALSRLGVRSFFAYTVAGIVTWFAFHESGVHATIAGVILGLMTPARSSLGTGLVGDTLRRADLALHGDWEAVSDRAEKLRRFQWAVRETISPLEYLENALHPWVAFLIMPVFALANAGVPIQVSNVASPVAFAVMTGLVVGKPVGIFVFSWLSVQLGLARLPDGVDWRLLWAGGCLAGIGFTMALFIAGLALEDDLLDTAKVGVLLGSGLSAVLGMGLMLTQRGVAQPATSEEAVAE